MFGWIANPKLKKAAKNFNSVKVRTDAELACNQKKQEQAQRLFEQTIAKLRAAEQAA